MAKMETKEFLKMLGITFAVAFFSLHILSIILSNWFPTFQNLVSKFSLAWMLIFLGLITYLVFNLIFRIKSFDKRSIFVMLMALAILIVLSIYFKIDYGKLFDMSIINTQLASILP